MLHLSLEKLYLLLWVLFVLVRSLLLHRFLRSVLAYIHTQSTQFRCLHFSYSLNFRRLFYVSFSLSFAKFDICMQLEFDDSSCGNPFGAKWAKKKSNSFERASKQISENWIEKLFFMFFFCRILTKWEAVSFIFFSYSNEVRSIKFIAFLSNLRCRSLEMTMSSDTKLYRVALGHSYF